MLEQCRQPGLVTARSIAARSVVEARGLLDCWSRLSGARTRLLMRLVDMVGRFMGELGV